MTPGPESTHSDQTPASSVESVLSRIERSDAERFDPPEDLWDRIASTVALHGAAARSRVVPNAATTGGNEPVTSMEYSIDADDRVVAVDENWVGFARANGATEIAGALPSGTIWDHFADGEVRDLWRLVVARVRSRGAELRVPLRCDAPDSRRWLEMTISPGTEGTVHFRSDLVFEEDRNAVPLLDPDAERDSRMPPVPVCEWCADGYDGSHWAEIEQVVRDLRLLEQSLPPVVHGICPSCREEMAAEINVGSSGTSPA